MNYSWALFIAIQYTTCWYNKPIICQKPHLYFKNRYKKTLLSVTDLAQIFRYKIFEA